MAHRKVFNAGGNSFKQYMRKMKRKYVKTLGSVGAKATSSTAKYLSIKYMDGLAAYVKSVAN